MKILTPGLRLILAVACLFIIIGGLRSAGRFLVPVVLAFFLTAINMPFIGWLRRRGLHHVLAVVFAVLVNLSVLGIVVGLTVNAVAEFLDEAPKHVDQMRVKVEALGNRVLEAPMLTQTEQLKDSKENFVGMIRLLTDQFTYELPSVNRVLDKIASLTGSVFFVFIVMVFMMTESLVMRARFEGIRQANGPRLMFLAQISKDIQRYLHIKTAVSLATGLLAWLLTWSFGLQFPLMWGLLAFALNYIPSIGSIIAAIPPSLLALWQLGVVPSCLIALGYLCINMSLGNFIEPMLLGRRFGISTLVVILSALFWGWVWGPVGMFVAIPLTMLIKVVLDNTEEFRWISVAMGKTSVELVRNPAWRDAQDETLEEGDLTVGDSEGSTRKTS